MVYLNPIHSTKTYLVRQGIFLPGPVPGAELYAYDYGDANAPDSESLRRFEIIGYAPGTNLHTLGIAYHEETSTLFVANARTDGATVEMFTLDLAAFTAVHFRTIRHPLLRGPNAIAILNDHELLVTNDHHFLIKESRFLAKMETYLDLSLGSVVHVDISSLLKDPTGTVEANVVARVSFANGIEVLNNTTIAVASTSKAKVFFYDLTRSDTASTTAPTLTHKSTVKFPFMVDNLQVSKDGSLYVAGHPYFPALEEFSKSRDMCNDYSKLATADPSVQEYCKTANAPSWVSRWTEARGVEHLYVGGEYPSSSTAAFDSERNVGIVTGLYAKGILVWRQ